jgi:hypothetical protein
MSASRFVCLIFSVQSQVACKGLKTTSEESPITMSLLRQSIEPSVRSKPKVNQELEMNLTELEKYVLAYFLAGEALHFHVDGRFQRREDFAQMFEGAFFFATKKFGDGIAGRYPNVVGNLLDELIATKALSSVTDKWTGVSHQFNSGAYKAFIKDQIRTNSICQRSQQAGPQFWEETFATLSRGERS